MICVFLSKAQKVVTGSVHDFETSEPLEDVTVMLKNGGTHSHSAHDGNFSIKVVKFPDTLIFSHIGYELFKIHLSGEIDKLHILLKEIEVQLGQVTVNGSRPVSGQVMNVDLKMTPVNSAQDLLRKVPGLFIAQHAGGGKAEQIFLRGFDCDHGTDVRITADGMPVNMVSHAHGQGYSDLHFLIPETIKDIDFGKGGYYADKGDFSTAGYVNMSTYDRLDNSMVKVEAGSFNTLRTVGMFNLIDNNNQQQAAKTNAYIAAEYNFTNGPFDVKQNFNRFNLFGKFNHQINDRSYISFQASTFNSNWNASGQIPDRAVEQGIITRWGSIDSTEGGNTSRTNIALKYKYRISDREDWQSFFYYSKYAFNLYSNFTFFLNDPVNGDEINQKESRNIYGFDHKYSKRFFFDKSDLTWESGVGLRMDDINDLELNHVYQRDSLLDRKSWGNGTETNLYAYTQAQWHPGKWMINPALRVDHFIFNYHNKLSGSHIMQGVQATALSPKLNFSYTPNQQLQWYIKTGMSFHSNDMRVVVEQNGYKTLPYSIGGDFGAIIKAGSKLVIQPALWYLYLQQEFVYVGDEAVVEPSGETQRLGFDISLRYQPVKWLYVDADVNYAHARYIGVAKSESYVPLAPRFTSTGGVAVKLPGNVSANLRYRYLQDRPANEDNTLIAKGYFVNDLALAYTRKHWEVTLQVQNLFNVDWKEAQFETLSRLKNEAVPVDEINFTPGTPVYLKAGIKVNF